LAKLGFLANSEPFALEDNSLKSVKLQCKALEETSVGEIQSEALKVNTFYKFLIQSTTSKSKEMNILVGFSINENISKESELYVDTLIKANAQIQEELVIKSAEKELIKCTQIEK
jgi:hypothetical protein